ncbi:MAG: sulfurtransferase TusA family protein [Spirochaetota bacterium]
MFRLPNSVVQGIGDYRRYLNDLLGGRVDRARFTGVRVPWGIYSHRGGKVFMTRIRLPGGTLTPSQMKAIAHVARTYGNGITHITTRQDMQLHEVKLEDTLEVIEYLKSFELSPRGGGGNTVRNVTACPFAGVCAEEAFDVRACVVSLTEHLLSREDSYNLPRKFKIAFSGCAKDCAACLANDVGLVAVESERGRGFKLFAGGGMGAKSRLGELLEDFIPEGDVGDCIGAIKNVYYKNGDRRNKHKNRLRFLVEGMGFDRFRKLYREELSSLKESERISLRKVEFPSPAEFPSDEFPRVSEAQFEAFLKYSVRRQKQTGLFNAELRIPRGDIRADRLEALAELEKDFAGLEFRTSQNQNIIACNLRKSLSHGFFLKVQGILEDFLYPSTLLDVVCCKGASTCNLGLCNSPGLAREIERVISEKRPTGLLLSGVDIRINGCQNACGQHPLGFIGLHGLARKVSGKPVPFYKVLIGGRRGVEKTRLARDTGVLIPARNVPRFIRNFLDQMEREADGRTDIYAFMETRGESILREIATRYSNVPPYSDKTKDFYTDWGKTEEFSLEGLGPGECGAGVLDLIESDLTLAKLALEKAEKKDYSMKEIREALFFSARALLVVRGSDPEKPEEALSGFREKFIREDIAPPRFANLPEIYRSLEGLLSPGEKEERFAYAKDFLETVNGLYRSMDSSFNFPRQKREAEAEGKAILDLKGTPCPINYVKARLFLEGLKSGNTVEILLDEGEPIANVPRSLEEEGHKILAKEKEGEVYRLLVRKR